MKPKPCLRCEGVGYIKPSADDLPPVPLEKGKGVAPENAQAVVNWLLWGKPCPRCGGSGKAITEEPSKSKEPSGD
jgi:DnaJ-class molecular chaperone